MVLNRMVLHRMGRMAGIGIDFDDLLAWRWRMATLHLEGVGRELY